MSTAANGAEIFIGAGKVYFDRFDTNGNSTGLRFLGNCPKFEITPSVDNEDVWDMTKKVRTKLAHIAKTQTHSVAIDTEEFLPKNVALALFGTDAIYTQTGGAITGEVLASSTAASSTVSGIPVAGQVFKVAQRNISLPTLKATTASAPTTLVLGTDYEIEDAGSGMIRIITAANFPAGITGLTLDYTAAAITATANKTMITAATSPQILGKIYFIGDPVAGRPIDAELWRVSLASTAALALIGENHGSISLTGEVLNDAVNHLAQPFYRTIER